MHQQQVDVIQMQAGDAAGKLFQQTRVRVHHTFQHVTDTATDSHAGARERWARVCDLRCNPDVSAGEGASSEALSQGGPDGSLGAATLGGVEVFVPAVQGSFDGDLTPLGVICRVVAAAEANGGQLEASVAQGEELRLTRAAAAAAGPPGGDDVGRCCWH